MAAGYHNIDRASPSKYYQYVGWDAAGRRFVIQKLDYTRGYRVAQIIVTDDSTPYFYASTLREVSESLASMH